MLLIQSSDKTCKGPSSVCLGFDNLLITPVESAPNLRDLLLLLLLYGKPMTPVEKLSDLSGNFLRNELEVPMQPYLIAQQLGLII